MDNEGLSIIKKAALSILDAIKDDIVNKWTDEEITSAVAMFNPNLFGYVKEDDFVNYDEALKILHMGNNRIRLTELCKIYGIENVRFNNMPIGFPKRDIIMMAKAIDEEVKERERKERRKKGQRKFLY